MRLTAAVDPYLPQLMHANEVVRAMKARLNIVAVAVFQVVLYKL